MAQKVSRNGVCPCGSGKKFKLCCLRSESRTAHPPLSRLNGGGPISFAPRQPSPRPVVAPPAEQREWHEVQAILEMPSGEAFVAVMVHSRQWLRAKNVKVGSPIPLNIPKYRLRGEGRVQSIQPTKTIPQGEGLVLGVVHLGKPDARSGPRQGEKLPPVGHEWLPLILSQAGELTSDLRLIRPTAWMDANWHRLEELENDHEPPADVAQWRLVHLSVSVQGGRKVHLSLFWQRRAVEAYRLTVGEPVLLRLPQSQLSGEGTLTAIDPAPFVPEPGMPRGMISLPGKEGGPCKGAIETTEVGDYVTTYTHEERGDRLPIDDTQGKWVARQRIRLRLDKEDGGHSKIVLLRDARWVRTERVAVGATVCLDMPEMGCVGDAGVEAVEPCLVFLRGGNSSIRMVTGTFKHSEGLCGELRLKGESKPLGVTPGHPFWSVDREDWVSVVGLAPGETVKTLQGTTTVESYTMCDQLEPTFNMEVEGDHVYRVGEQGILVHNSSDPCDTLCQKDGAPDPGLPEHKPAVEFYAELYMKDSIPIGTGATSKFTSGDTGQIVKIIALNRKRNSGVVKSDDPADPFQLLRSGPEDLYREEIAAGTVRWEDERMRFLVWVADGRKVSLVTLPGPTMGDERRGRQVAVIDHIRPKDGGGSNSYCNARVISKALNSIKGNR